MAFSGFYARSALWRDLPEYYGPWQTVSGGFSTKIHLRCDGNGRPITFLISVGERHEAVLFEPLMEQGSVKGEGPGRPRIRPGRVSGDKGYSSDIP